MRTMNHVLGACVYLVALTGRAPMHVQGGAVEHQGTQNRIPLALSQQEARPGWEDGDSVHRSGGDHQRGVTRLTTRRYL